METKDLMVGDWLQHASGKYFQVTRIDMWGDGSMHFACGHPHLWEYNNLPMEQCWQQYGLRLYLSGHGYGINCGENVSLRIDNVHELQHALRLCGIEKEIEL